MAAVHLLFVEYKALLKWFWKYESIKEIQRQWQREFGTPIPTHRTIARIRNKFRANRTIKDVHKGKSCWTRTATSLASSAAVLQHFIQSLVYWFLQWMDEMLQHRSTGHRTCSCSCSAGSSLVNIFNSSVCFKFVVNVGNCLRCWWHCSKLSLPLSLYLLYVFILPVPLQQSLAFNKW